MAGCTSAKMATASIQPAARTLPAAPPSSPSPRRFTPSTTHSGRAKELSDRPQGPPPHHLRHLRRQGVRQQATYKRVLRYLDTNKITVYGTLWATRPAGRGLHQRITALQHVRQPPLQVHRATGGTPDSERDLNGIEKSYAKIAEEPAPSTPWSTQPRIHLRQQVPQDRCPRRPPRPGGLRRLGYYPSAQDSH